VRCKFYSGPEACHAASDNKKIYRFFAHTGRIQDEIAEIKQHMFGNVAKICWNLLKCNIN